MTGRESSSLEPSNNDSRKLFFPNKKGNSTSFLEMLNLAEIKWYAVIVLSGGSLGSRTDV